jgi:hypothetical protein
MWFGPCDKGRRNWSNQLCCACRTKVNVCIWAREGSRTVEVVNRNRGSASSVLGCWSMMSSSCSVSSQQSKAKQSHPIDSL